MNRVLREAVQTFIDCAENEKDVFTLLKQGEGKVIITGIYLISLKFEFLNFVSTGHINMPFLRCMKYFLFIVSIDVSVFKLYFSLKNKYSISFFIYSLVNQYN